MTDNPFEILSRRTRPEPVLPGPITSADIPATSPSTPPRPRPEPEPGDAASAGLGSFKLFQSQRSTWTMPDATPTERHVPVQTGESRVDWVMVRSLRTTAASRLQEALQSESGDSAAASREQRRAVAEPIIRDVIRAAETSAIKAGQNWANSLAADYEKAVLDSMFGLGRWQPLLEIADAENIIIQGSQPVMVEHATGEISYLPPVADSDEELTEQVEMLAQNSTPPRAFDTMHTDVTINYQDRFRIHAVSSEVSRQPSVAIRQHLHTRIGLGDLVDGGVMPHDVAVFLARAVALKKTIFVIGDVGDGKTTTLRALIDAIPLRERFATLETDLELYAHLMPGREYTLVLTARDGMGERNADGSMAGEIQVGELIPPALRQAIARIIVGELRGWEAGAMFEAMQAGAGSMSTMHSSSCDRFPERLATLVARSPIYTLNEAQRQIGLSVDLVIHVRKLDTPQGRRRIIQEIRTMTNGDNDRASGSEVYRADPFTGATIQFTPGHMDHYEQWDAIEVELNRYENHPGQEGAA